MKQVTQLLWVLLAVFLIAGCSQKKNVKPPPVDDQPKVQSDDGQINPDIDPHGRAGKPIGGVLAQRVIYFDFDQTEVRAEGRELITAHAAHLVSNPNLRVTLEGHADERGSREYNIGLGEGRAQAVRQLLLFQGVAARQISTVSYGEERPADPGHDETAWAQNRRVEIVYQNQ